MPERSKSGGSSWPRLALLVALVAVLGAAGGSPTATPQPFSPQPIVARATTTTIEAPTTTATAAPTTTTTTTAAVAAPTTTTNPPDPPPPPAPTPPTPRPAKRPVPTAAPPRGDTRLEQVESIADSSGWDWRTVHVHFRIGFKPEDCCHWGVFDPQDHKTIWIGPTAFDSAARLRYVVLHELAHAWQWRTHRTKKLSADMAPWGYQDVEALEAGADCIATLWGADAAAGHYWTCPPTAKDLMSRRLAGQWK